MSKGGRETGEGEIDWYRKNKIDGQDGQREGREKEKGGKERREAFLENQQGKPGGYTWIEFQLLKEF